MVSGVSLFSCLALLACTSEGASPCRPHAHYSNPARPASDLFLYAVGFAPDGCSYSGYLSRPAVDRSIADELRGSLRFDSTGRIVSCVTATESEFCQTDVFELEPRSVVK